ncbi:MULTISPECIES: tRNA (5-methylaminomethyl-2-thiouridine)(34)-methyltransferase MnmD [unclassified Nitratiruptor]|uniref:tRNA (5-methylaminomethyl-2-thiouridine)(34)-methyltransferase MnmD n=1 Tax=unclassified Nitratiruptor TaxID=2624044 RepID=UPI001915B3F8|nr:MULTISPECIES: MnmC family methyltransferase [unclassified Nitratiruptor]BCD60897.1 hypothetical protein NitYY0810_C1675 [Nitratiruptor sp. YY08-10]BCD64829.1 hypothetical protein NitYY0814_C1683 [Nitratiruptor sp. YY08-14]
MDYELKKTADGSYTLYSKQYDECYHNIQDGALTEALQKHIIPAFSYSKKKHLNIVDICFGLGINTLATIDYFLHQNEVESIAIYSPELDENLLESLPSFQYPKQLENYKDILERLIQHGKVELPTIQIELFKGDARSYIKKLKDIDVVYQDAFSPKKNPELWTLEYFQELYQVMSEDGILTTYSIATPVRLGLWEAGFIIYEKRFENIKKMTIGSKKELDLPKVDMALKQKRSTSQPLRDADVEKA